MRSCVDVYEHVFGKTLKFDNVIADIENLMEAAKSQLGALILNSQVQLKKWPLASHHIVDI